MPLSLESPPIAGSENSWAMVPVYIGIHSGIFDLVEFLFCVREGVKSGELNYVVKKGIFSKRMKVN